MFKTTIKQLAEKLGVDYAEAQGLVRYLESKGIAKKTGETVKAATGKGKGSDIWELPTTVNLVLSGSNEVIQAQIIPPAPPQVPSDEMLAILGTPAKELAK